MRRSAARTAGAISPACGFSPSKPASTDKGRRLMSEATNLPSLATMPIEQALDVYAPNFLAVLPGNIPVERFKRMVITALNTNPDLAQADRRSLFNSCIKCASDGLLPDGREAALVVYNTKIKRGSREYRADMVRYLPMIAGIRKRMHNSGEVDGTTAEVVYQ